MANLVAAFASGQVVRFEDENAGRCFDHVLHPVAGANGNCEKVIAIARDITDRKLMEEAFRESEERYRSIFENSLDAILVTDREGEILEANPAAYEIFGCPRQEVFGFGMDLLCDATDSESQKLLTGLSSGAKMNREVTQVRKDGSSFPAEISSASFKSRQGEKRNILVIRDISERKQSEEALRRAKLELETRVQERTIGLIEANERLAKSEEKYRQLVEHAPAGILEVDLVRNRFVSANDVICRYTGYTKEEFLSIGPYEILAEESQPRFTERMAKLFLGQEVLETADFKIRGKNGREFWVMIHVKFLYREGVPHGATVVIHDITPLKKSEEALRESEQRFREVLESSLDFVYRRNLRKAGYDYLSPSIQAITGYTPEEFRSLSQEDLLSLIHPEDRERVANELAQAAAAEKGNSLFEYRFKHKEGSYRWYSDLVAFVKDDRGENLYFVGHLRDITDQKESEHALKKYTARLEVLNQELEDFSYITSHDLQEPLRKIQILSDLIAGRYAAALDDGGRDYLARLESSARRAQELIQAIRSYSRLTNKLLPFKEVDLKRIVEKAVSNLKDKIEEAGAHIRIGELPSLTAVPHLIRLLFQNLLSNSITYRRNEPSVIRISARKIGEDLQITVEDNGIGFDEKYTDLIFKPFKRLSSGTGGEGIGMGLAICRKIVDLHGGTITAESKPGKGSTFLIHLPMRRPKEPFVDR
jgi:two-component system, LuxR family, sensor kinase FixL